MRLLKGTANYNTRQILPVEVEVAAAEAAISTVTSTVPPITITITGVKGVEPEVNMDVI